MTSSPDESAGKLNEAGSPARWDEELAPRRRFSGKDPFGNRLEFTEPKALRLQGSEGWKVRACTAQRPQIREPEKPPKEAT